MSSTMTNSCPVMHPSNRARQRGVVLIVAMVMLVVISMASVAIMRNTMSTDTVSDNTRRQTQALQFAQAALRYCENKIVQTTLVPAPAAVAPAQENWKTFSNWQDPTKYQEVDKSFLVSQGQNTNVPHLPQCMAQYSSLAGGSSVIVVTARGFSDNYVQSNGRTQAGSVIWLQSIIQLKVDDAG